MRTFSQKSVYFHCRITAINYGVNRKVSLIFRFLESEIVLTAVIG